MTKAIRRKAGGFFLRSSFRLNAWSFPAGFTVHLAFVEMGFACSLAMHVGGTVFIHRELLPSHGL